MAHAYSETALVEQATMEVLASLGHATASASDEVFGAGGTLGRESPREVVLVARLRAALVALNPAAPAVALDLAVDELLRDRVAMGAAAANREVYRLLTEGVKVALKDERTGDTELRTLRVVDWERPAQNDWLAVQQLSLRGPLYTCIPDVVLFVLAQDRAHEDPRAEPSVPRRAQRHRGDARGARGRAWAPTRRIARSTTRSP